MGVIPQHDLTATLTQRDGPGVIEVTLVWFPAVYDEDDPPNLIEPESWRFSGDTFPPLADPEGPLADGINMYCVDGFPAVAFDYDGVVGDNAFDVNLSPFHVVFEDPDVNPFTRYSSIVVDDP